MPGVRQTSNGVVQTTAGVVSTAEIPDRENLQLNLDAQSITGLSDGGTLSSWPDESGTGNDATGGTGATYRASTLNGLPGVEYDGVDDYHEIPTSTDSFNFLHDGSGGTVYAVVSSWANQFQALFGSRNLSAQSVGITHSLETDEWNFVISDGVGGSTATLVSEGAGDNLHTIRTGTGTSPNVDVEIGGKTSSSASMVTSGNNATNNFQIGQDGADDFYADITMHQILIYQSRHDDSTKSDVQTYLSNRWAL